MSLDSRGGAAQATLQAAAGENDPELRGIFRPLGKAVLLSKGDVCGAGSSSRNHTTNTVRRQEGLTYFAVSHFK